MNDQPGRQVSTREQAAAAPKYRVRKALFRGIVYGLLTTLACAVLIIFAVVSLRSAGALQATLRAMEIITPYAVSFRLALYAALWWRWQRAVDWVIARGWFSSSARDILVQRRNKWVCTLVGLEILMFLMARPTAGA